MTMPAVTFYAMAVWLLCGGLTHHWWWQLLCISITTYLMVELNNINALIRIFSRMVSSTFLTLLCSACFVFPALPETVMLTCMTAFILLLFLTYQDKEAAGLTYYAFLFLGVGSIAYIHVLFFLPLIWLLMMTHTMSLSWRTWMASLLGLLTPYWFYIPWIIYQRDYSAITNHFMALTVFEEPFNLYGITDSQKATLGLVILLAIIGTTHNAMLLLMIVNTSPLVAHFAALSSTKLTNITFMVLCAASLLLTAYNIWMFSSLS